MCGIKLACITGSCQLTQCDIEYDVLSLRGQGMKRIIVSTVSESSEHPPRVAALKITDLEEIPISAPLKRQRNNVRVICV